MRKATAFIAVLALLIGTASITSASNAVRISQVYGGGGATSGTPAYAQDYVELYNNSGVVVDISNWTIEYGSATGNWGSNANNIFTFPQGTEIRGCSYLLVAMPGTNSTGTPYAGSALPVTPDFEGVAFPSASGPQLTMSATSGKVALFSAVNTNTPCGSELAGTLVDKVAYGTANCAEGTAVGTLANTNGAVRNGGGTVDTDNNLNDFTIETPPVPRSSASPPNVACTVIGVEMTPWSDVKVLYR